ncbi:uncharacterized protein BP5553_05418 [Venustampulla echinocandica]|uniref:Uncharacterized protein n=1 Tax=Venustampulla echinocandica TaxID=2656787 RepID=A0A370TR25_9HELO|nr:uncharacterized protein BP5553_05418 [Venustampulla echinocandica]RDL37985.1 hypothetical protein BP5553_05418 [Venustampulla echinocandica]
MVFNILILNDIAINNILNGIAININITLFGENASHYVFQALQRTTKGSSVTISIPIARNQPSKCRSILSMAHSWVNLVQNSSRHIIWANGHEYLTEIEIFTPLEYLNFG